MNLWLVVENFRLLGRLVGFHENHVYYYLRGTGLAFVDMLHELVLFVI